MTDESEMKGPTEFAIENGIVNEETIALSKSKLNDCYNRLIEVLKNYVDMKEDYYKFVATWVIGTYFHEEFNTYPFLFFNAMRGSGKTRTLKLISALGAKGDGSVQNNLTEAVLFRISRGTTTCIDELEQIGSKEKQTLRELLNSAYKKGMKVKRMRKAHTKDGEQQVTETFEPYFPIAMANIWGMDEVLADRSVTLILEKSDSPAITRKIEDFDTNPKIIDIKRTLTKVSAVSAVSLHKKNIIQHWNDYINDKYTTTHTTLTTQNNTITSSIESLNLEEFFNRIDEIGLGGRNFELLFPIILTSEQIGEECFKDILQIGKEITQLKKEDEYTESRDISFIEFVSMQDKYRFEYVPLKKLTSEFKIFLGEEDDWLNDKWVGKALKRLQLFNDRKRQASGRFILLSVDKAKEKLKIFKTSDTLDNSQSNLMGGVPNS